MAWKQKKPNLWNHSGENQALTLDPMLEESQELKNYTTAAHVDLSDINKAKIKYVSVSCNVLKKIRVGRSEKYLILFFHFIL